jgi:hypothetical protein
MVEFPLRIQHQLKELPSNLSDSPNLLDNPNPSWVHQVQHPLAMLNQVLDNLVFQIPLDLTHFQMSQEWVNQECHRKVLRNLQSKCFPVMNRMSLLM